MIPPQQSRNDLVQRAVGLRFNFACGLILNRMLHIDGIEIRPTQGSGLSASRQCKLGCCDSHGRNTPILEPDRIVQTARCAGPSVGQGLDHSIYSPQFLNDLFRGRLSESWFRVPHDAPNSRSFQKQRFEAIKEDGTSGFAYIQKRDRFSRKSLQTRCRPPNQFSFVAWINKSYGHG